MGAAWAAAAGVVGREQEGPAESREGSIAEATQPEGMLSHVRVILKSLRSEKQAGFLQLQASLGDAVPRCP